MSGMCSNSRKDSWNVMFVGDNELRNGPVKLLDVGNNVIIPTDIVEDSGDGYYSMSSTPGMHVLNMVDDIIYIKVTGSLSKWETHMFLVNIQSPGIKKVVLHLKDTVSTM
ncbi:hypothetical protein EDC04DRAFT_2608104 [Pisolithus marmoratus]|nr:hypothetical protein EDC04DRAFT_2608104 [Pisolithus marmoratus]